MVLHRKDTTVRAAVLAALCLAAPGLASCSTSAGDPETAWCVPALAAAPATASPGDTVTLIVSGGCAQATPATGWILVAAPVGDVDTGVRVTTAQPVEDGFRIELTLPADFPVGDAFIGIENWDYSACDDTGASCASASADFTVTAAP